VSGGHQFTALAAGYSFTCGLKAGGEVWCWGFNASGSLGDGTTTNSQSPVQVFSAVTFASISIGATGTHACALSTTGEAYCWGDNTYGQVGNGTSSGGVSSPVTVSTGLTFATITAGGYHTCAVTSLGSMYCWGRNYAGEIGDGTPDQRDTPVPVTTF